MEYDSEEAREDAKAKLKKLMDERNDHDKSNWLHCGSLESAKALGLKSLHEVKDLRHLGFGDFADLEFVYERIVDTKAGRIYHRVKR